MFLPPLRRGLEVRNTEGLDFIDGEAMRYGAVPESPDIARGSLPDGNEPEFVEPEFVEPEFVVAVRVEGGEIVFRLRCCCGALGAKEE